MRELDHLRCNYYLISQQPPGKHKKLMLEGLKCQLQQIEKTLKEESLHHNEK